MIQEVFEVETTIEEKEEKISIRMAEVSPIIISDILSESLNKNRVYKPGTLIKLCIENNVIISPKNLLEKIEKSEDGLSLIGEIFQDLYTFCISPGQYAEFRERKRIKEQSLQEG